MLTIDLPLGFELHTDGLHLNVEKPGAAHRYFRKNGNEGGLPVRIQVMTGRGEKRKQNDLFEEDFQAEEPTVREADRLIRLTGRCQGLILTQEVKWEETEVPDVGPCLMVSRRVLLGIESVEFTAPEFVRLLALTRWGDLEEGRSYELSTHMGWHFRAAGRGDYRAWVTPCMFDADGPGTEENYRPSSVHTMGMAEYTVLSWPGERRAVMAAEDPVDYLERNINPDTDQMGPAQVAVLGWFEPTDRGATYETPWQDYYFLEDEDDPLVTSARIWRERYAPRLNEYAQPAEELEPWFATENLYGPNLVEAYAKGWDGNLTDLEAHYAALRRDPLDNQIHPILVHERPGFSAIVTNKNQYFHSVETPAGSVQLNVPLLHRTGDRFTISCSVRPGDAPHDLGFEASATSRAFRFEGVALVPFKRLSAPAPEVPLESVQVDQSDGQIRVKLGVSADSLQADLRGLEDHYPIFEVRFRVTREIPPDEGRVEAFFLYREKGGESYERLSLVSDRPEKRGEHVFDPEHYPLQVRMGLLPTSYVPRMQAYNKPNIFFEVKNGSPVRLEEEALARRLGELMRRYDVALTVYVAAYGIRNYDYSRNANHLIPDVLAQNQDRKPRPRWYTGIHRADELCPVCERHNRMLDECLQKLLEWGPFGVYYDELCGGPGSCFGREHGHGLSQHLRLAHQRGERMRDVARKAGYPEMYMGTEVGNLLQHTFAQGHNFDGVNPGRKDNQFEDIKRMILGQHAYDFPGSRIYFNYVLSSQLSADKKRDNIFGHVLGLAFPRFSLAPFTGIRQQVATYFAAGVKRAFPAHYRNGRTEFPLDAVRPQSPPPTTLALTLRSDEALSVHFANLSEEDLVMEKDGFRARVTRGNAVLADSFGNLLGETDLVQWEGSDYIRLERLAALGLWRSGDGAAYLQAVEADRKSLTEPLRIFLSSELLNRIGASDAGTPEWQGLDSESSPIKVQTTSVPGGMEVVYPAGDDCRCLYLGSEL